MMRKQGDERWRRQRAKFERNVQRRVVVLGQKPKCLEDECGLRELREAVSTLNQS